MRWIVLLFLTFWAVPAGATNVVLVMLDDARASDMLQHMPRTMALLGPRAVNFPNTFAEVSLCAPSRATLLTGRYAHNHGVHTCEVTRADSEWPAFRRSEGQTLAVWLRAAGYRTGLFGKYFNGYDNSGSCGFVPPGWSTWAAWCGGVQGRGWNYDLSVNGRKTHYGTAQADFATDVLATHTDNFIRASVAAGKSFFAEFVPSSGHASWAYPARHAGLYPDELVPGPFDNDLSDLPAAYQAVAVPPAADLSDTYRRYLRSIASADEAVERFYRTLSALGKLSSTWIIVTSDHGAHFGEHGLGIGKQTGFDTDVRIPLLVRGPGLTSRTDTHLVSMADIAPTILRLLNVPVPPSVDGVSLHGLLAGSPPAVWREAVPLAHWPMTAGQGVGGLPKTTGVRTRTHTLIRWSTGERELYDNVLDPNQLTNRAGTDPALQSHLEALTARLANCAGTTCR